jgi:hypothetical protein
VDTIYPTLDRDDAVALSTTRIAKAQRSLWWNELCGAVWLSGLTIALKRNMQNRLHRKLSKTSGGAESSLHLPRLQQTYILLLHQ